MEPIIVLNNVVKEYKDEFKNVVRALDIDRLEIERGEFVVVLGASGSGKSTLLNTIGVQNRVTEGEVFIDGKNYSSSNDSERAGLRGRKIGYVFQDYGLVPDYTVYQNIDLALIIAGSKDKKRVKKEKITEAVAAVGLDDCIKKKAYRLSGGEKQRCAIARAMINDPDIILADEPTGALDTVTGEKIIRLLKSVNDSGTTVIVVTHNAEIGKIADRVIVLSDGKIIEVIHNRCSRVAS